jgi:hypothetical protein
MQLGDPLTPVLASASGPTHGCGVIATLHQPELPMPTIYISDRGDDKNDGLSLQTAVYSLKRAKKLQVGKNDFSWQFGPRARKRIQTELSEKKED